VEAGWAKSGVLLLRASAERKLRGVGAAVDFGQFGHFGAMLENALSIPLDTIPLAQ
jgi:hypothetical protein